MTHSTPIGTSPIRRRKLLPPDLGSALISRPRLESVLDRSLVLPLTLLVAPAGYGKTTLVRQWEQRRSITAIWLTLDQDDVNGTRLVRHLIAALQPVMALDGAIAGESSGGPMSEMGGAIADALFDLESDLLIILDDAHSAISRDLRDFLASMVRLIPPRVHLIVLSRLDIPASLARMRAQGHVSELRAADLRFTRHETAALLDLMAPDQSAPEVIDFLQDQTDGWATGLHIAIEALPLTSDPGVITRGSSGQRHLMQFLVEELLAHERAEDQGFLIRTSLVSEISGPLADALVDDSTPGANRDRLQRLAQANLFLGESDIPGWFRFHPLFRQLLQTRLHAEVDANEIVVLHERAGAWFAAEGQVAEALPHLVAAGEMDAAAALIERQMHDALAREDWRSVASWLRLLPEEVVHSHPELLLARGLIAHLSGRAAPLRLLVAEIKALTDARTDSRKAAAILAEADILALGTLIPIEQDPEQARRIVDDALEHLPESHRFFYGLGISMYGYILHALGQERDATRYLEAITIFEAERFDAASIRALLGLMFIHRQSGAMNALADVCHYTLAITSREQLAVTAAWAHMFMGWHAYEQNDLDTAQEQFSAVIANSWYAHLSCVREAHFGLALVHQVQGRERAADQVLAQLTDFIVDARALEHLPVVDGFEARIALMRGNLETARQWTHVSEVSIDSNTLIAFEHALITRIRVLLAVGTSDTRAEALRDLEIARARAMNAHHYARLVEINALLALAHDAEGNAEAARAALLDAFGFAVRGTFVRSFLDLGQDMVTLLRGVQPSIVIPPELSDALAGEYPASLAAEPNAGSAASLLSSLSLREQDVLELLAQRLSYQEIADHLFISAGTVKRHVSSIYSKLDVGNRREALLKAESLGWTLAR